MSSVERITISLPDRMVSEIKAAIEAGEFTNVSEVVRDALRQWHRVRTVIALNDEELRGLVEEGRASGQPVDGEQVLTRLQGKFAALPDS